MRAMKAAAIHCLLASIDNHQQTIHQRLLHPHTRAGVQVLLLIASANFCALSSHLAETTSPLKHKSNIPSQLELCKSVGSSATWNGPQVDCEASGTGTPRPRTQQGHPQNCADEACVVWSCSRGLRWPGWESQNQNLWNLCYQILPAAPQHQPLPSPAPLTLQGCLELLFGRLAKVSGQGVPWVGLGGRCELYRETETQGPTPHEWGCTKKGLGWEGGCARRSG
eukprot:557628-Pelagomonas_calceolata.AAC.2